MERNISKVRREKSIIIAGGTVEVTGVHFRAWGVWKESTEMLSQFEGELKANACRL